MKLGKIDLHSHSSASDGAHAPSEVVALAHRTGLRVLALTDHDTVGWVDEAVSAASGVGMALVPGVEATTARDGSEIHVVGLGVDTLDAGLLAFLANTRAARETRARAIAERLEALGFAGAYEGAVSVAGGAESLSRTHFAKWLHSQGRVKTFQKAFDLYLGERKPAWVGAAWPAVDAAVAAIKGAGGVAVLAHPAGYKLRSVGKLVNLIDFFRECGGDAVEVCTGNRDGTAERTIARATAARGLWGSVGSDFHRAGHWPPLGAAHQLPGEVEPVWRHIPGLDGSLFEDLGIGSLWGGPTSRGTP